MSTVKVVNVQHPSASTAAVTLAADGSMSGAFPAPNRNLIYNGAMQVAQRGTSATGITTTGYYTADRWKFNDVTMGTYTESVEADAPEGFASSLKVLCTTADASPAATDQIAILQGLEGQDVQRVAKGTASAQQLTLSFWVKSNVTGTYTATLRDVDNARGVSASYTVDASATWEHKTVTFPADSTGAWDNDNAQSLQLMLNLGGGSDYAAGGLQTSWGSWPNGGWMGAGQTNLAAATNNYWQVTGVQLEVGPVATGFEFKSYGQELRECQRYYWRPGNRGGSGNYGVARAQSSTFANVLINLPTSMRATPSAIDFSTVGLQTPGISTVAVTAITVDASSSTDSVCAFGATVSSGLSAGTWYIFSNNSGGYLGFSAEL